MLTIRGRPVHGWKRALFGALFILALPAVVLPLVGGSHEFNPLGLVFRPLRRTREFRFWKAFRELKQGRPEALDALTRDFFEAAKAVPPN